MTVQFLAAWNGYEDDQVATFSAAEEARLVALGICRTYTAGIDGRSLAPVLQDPVSGQLYAGSSLASGVGRILANTARGLVLLDTTAGARNLDTPFGIAATIPGNLMQPTSKLLVWSGVDWTLGNGKSHYIKIGPASQTYATAVQVSGWSNFSTQNFSAVSALICNDGVLNRQRSTPANAVSFLNGSGSQMAVTNVDTTLDWNIYVGIQHGTENGGASATDRQFFVLLLP